MNTNTGLVPRNTGIQAAKQFYQLIKAGNPIATARWRDIQAMARQGDLEAIRAVRLMLAVMRQPMVGAVTPQATPQQIEMLRAILVQARNAPPVAVVATAPAPRGETPAQYPPQQTATIPGINPATGRLFEQIPGTPLGFMGEGSYLVVEPDGLFLYPAPNPSLPTLRSVPVGTMVRVIGFAPPPSPTGWAQVILPSGEGGYICMSCQEYQSNIPSPWLVRKS